MHKFRDFKGNLNRNFHFVQEKIAKLFCLRTLIQMIVPDKHEWGAMSVQKQAIISPHLKASACKMVPVSHGVHVNAIDQG